MEISPESFAELYDQLLAVIRASRKDPRLQLAALYAAYLHVGESFAEVYGITDREAIETIVLEEWTALVEKRGPSP